MKLETSWAQTQTFAVCHKKYYNFDQSKILVGFKAKKKKQ